MLMFYSKVFDVSRPKFMFYSFIDLFCVRAVCVRTSAKLNHRNMESKITARATEKKNAHTYTTKKAATKILVQKEMTNIFIDNNYNFSSNY